MNLIIDKNRKDYAGTGIFIRAKDGENFGTFDISELTKESLLLWLKSRGGDNNIAEDTVGILLGHGHLHDLKKKDDVR